MLGIQLAVTACLYNLAGGEMGENLHPRVLSQIVNADLNAMEDFKNHKQLQKNVLLTICNDHILQDVSFDKYRCARLAMDCLVNYEDVSMNRLSVAVCSILGMMQVCYAQRFSKIMLQAHSILPKMPGDLLKQNRMLS